MNKGIKYILLSTICFSIVNVFVKFLGHSSELFPDLQIYPVHELVFFRSLVSLAICFSILKYRKIPILGKNKKWLFIRGLFGTISLTLFFYTLKELPLAVAVSVQYLSPIFTVILAIFMLKEKVSPIQWFFFFIAFSGVLFISLKNQPDVLLNISPLWIIIGLLSSIGSGVAYIAILKCKGSDNALNIVFYFPLIAVPITLIWCFYDFVFPRGIEWLFLLIMGVFTQFAQVLMTKALHEGGAVKITPFNYIGAIYAFLIGWGLFGEFLDLSIVTGILLILMGVLGNAFFKIIKKSWDYTHAKKV